MEDEAQEPSHDRHAQFKGLALDLLEITIHVGMMGSVVPSWPPDVQENWDERVKWMREWANTQILEIQAFAESYDGD